MASPQMPAARSDQRHRTPRPRALAVVMAGGKGSRLDVLTRERAKPALPYGGSWRLIDLVLSNIANSGLDDVRVAVGYQPATVVELLGGGRPWDLDRTRGGLQVIVPGEGRGSAEEEGAAHGNADLLYRIRHELAASGADQVVVCSADHVYRYDLREALEEHRASGAECLVVVARVPMEEAGDHAVIETSPTQDGGLQVTALHDKPDDPVSDQVAAEIFVYDTAALVEALEELRARTSPGAEDGDTGLGDFGDHLVPRFIERGTCRAVVMDGYWWDVGRPSVYWRAHHDLATGAVPELAEVLGDPDWRMYTSMPQRPPARVRGSARIADTLLANDCDIAGEVRESVIGAGSIVEAGAVVEQCVLFSGVTVRAGAVVRGAIVDTGAHIGAGATVGARLAGPQPASEEVTLVGRDAVVGEGATVPGGARLEPGTTV